MLSIVNCPVFIPLFPALSYAYTVICRVSSGNVTVTLLIFCCVTTVYVRAVPLMMTVYPLNHAVPSSLPLRDKVGLFIARY